MGIVVNKSMCTRCVRTNTHYPLIMVQINELEDKDILRWSDESYSLTLSITHPIYFFFFLVFFFSCTRYTRCVSCSFADDELPGCCFPNAQHQMTTTTKTTQKCLRVYASGCVLVCTKQAPSGWQIHSSKILISFRSFANCHHFGNVEWFAAALDGSEHTNKYQSHALLLFSMLYSVD